MLRAADAVLAFVLEDVVTQTVISGPAPGPRARSSRDRILAHRGPPGAADGGDRLRGSRRRAETGMGWSRARPQARRAGHRRAPALRRIAITARSTQLISHGGRTLTHFIRALISTAVVCVLCLISAAHLAAKLHLPQLADRLEFE